MHRPAGGSAQSSDQLRLSGDAAPDREAGWQPSRHVKYDAQGPPTARIQRAHQRDPLDARPRAVSVPPHRRS